MHDSQAGRFLASPIVLEGRAGGLTLGSCGAALGSSTAWACSGKLDYKKRYGAFDRRERVSGVVVQQRPPYFIYSGVIR